MRKVFGVLLAVIVLAWVPSEAQTVSYAAPSDVQAAALRLASDLTNDYMTMVNAYLSMVQGGYSREEQRFADDEARIKALEQFAQEYVDANPCEPRHVKIERATDTGPVVVSFTTYSDKCVPWIAGGYNYGGTPNLQATRGVCSVPSQVPTSYDATLAAGTFAIALPSTWPEHGCLVINTYDKAANKKSKQYTY
jgi:hypothetical protein